MDNAESRKIFMVSTFYLLQSYYEFLDWYSVTLDKYIIIIVIVIIFIIIIIIYIIIYITIVIFVIITVIVTI